jgi:hypothetical protein
MAFAINGRYREYIGACEASLCRKIMSLSVMILASQGVLYRSSMFAERASVSFSFSGYLNGGRVWSLSLSIW